LQSALRNFVAPVVFTTGLLLTSSLTGFAQDVKPEQDAKPVQDSKPETKPDAKPAETKPSSDKAPLHTLLNTEDSTDQTAVPYTPITLKQKYEYSLEQMFSGPRLLSIIAHTALDQVEVSPRGWGSNAPSLGVRVASEFGRSFVRATISSGIRGLDHEDPRYFYSHKKSNYERVKYAVIHTFEVHNDNGSMMPAYSRFLGDFGMPFLAQTWKPGGINVPDALRSGGIGIGMGIGMTIAQEFWPDVKHALHLGPGTAALVSPGTIH
jgi:hypothetical protein